MRIAITGVSGFLGSFIARRLHAQGHTISGLVRPTSRRDHISAVVDRFVTGSQEEDSGWPALLEGADCVVHNSVDRSAFGEDGYPGLHLQANLVGSIKFLKASAPRQFIFISSIAVHHDMRPRWGGVIDEDHPLRPASDYGAYKAAVEAHLWAEHFSEGRHTSAVRPCGVYGLDPELSRSHGYDMINDIRAGKPVRKPGGGKWIHVEDVASAVAAIVGNPGAAGKPYNMVDCYARYADWAGMAAEVLGTRADVDASSAAQPKNTFSKGAVQGLGVAMDRGHEGIREHLRQLAAAMRD